MIYLVIFLNYEFIDISEPKALLISTPKKLSLQVTFHHKGDMWLQGFGRRLKVEIRRPETNCYRYASIFYLIYNKIKCCLPSLLRFIGWEQPPGIQPTMFPLRLWSGHATCSALERDPFDNSCRLHSVKFHSVSGILTCSITFCYL